MDKTRSLNPYKMFREKAVANKTPWIKTVASTHTIFRKKARSTLHFQDKTVVVTIKIFLVAKPFADATSLPCIAVCRP